MTHVYVVTWQRNGDLHNLVYSREAASQHLTPAQIAEADSGKLATVYKDHDVDVRVMRCVLVEGSNGAQQ